VEKPNNDTHGDLYWMMNFCPKDQRVTNKRKEGINAPDGTILKGSYSGWSNSEIFCKTHHNQAYITVINCNILHWMVLATVKEQDIHLSVLPPYTSHFLQPLDMSVFRPFKTKFYSIIRCYINYHCGQRLLRNFCYAWYPMHYHAPRQW